MIAYEIDKENTDRSGASELCRLDFIDPMIPPQAVSHSIESHKPEKWLRHQLLQLYLKTNRMSIDEVKKS